MRLTEQHVVLATVAMCINLCCYCYCTVIIIVILLMVFGSILQVTKTQNAAGGNISFAVSRITVNEGTTASTVPVSIPLQRTAGSSGIATAFYMV